MEVDFNGLRLRLAQEYNSLVNVLNGNTDSEGWVRCPSGDIDELLYSIRGLVGGLLACYDDSGAKDLSKEVTLVEFAPEE